MLNSLKSMKRMKIMAFFIVLQLSISMILVNTASGIAEGYKVKLDGFTRLMNSDKTYLLRVRYTEDMEKKSKEMGKQNIADTTFEEMMYDIKDFEKGLIDLKEKGVVKNIFINCPYSNVIDGYIPDKYKNIPEGQDIGINLWGLLVNYDFISNYNLDMYEGRQFTIEDFQVDYRNEPIPVILGKEYKEKLKVGDVVEGKLEVTDYLLNNEKPVDINKYKDKNGNLNRSILDLKYKVIGFYDDSAIPIMLAKETFVENVKFSNSNVILPCIKGISEYSEATAIRELGVFVEVSSKGDLEIIKKELEPKLKENNLRITVQDLSREVESIKEPMYREVLNSSLLGGMLLFLSIIGISSVLIGELSERKKEFGIRIVCGAQIKTLCKEMLYEIILMVTMAVIISMCGILIKELVLKEVITISLNVILTNVAIIGIISTIISIIPVLKLRKMNPVDLVRGE